MGKIIRWWHVAIVVLSALLIMMLAAMAKPNNDYTAKSWCEANWKLAAFGNAETCTAWMQTGYRPCEVDGHERWCYNAMSDKLVVVYSLNDGTMRERGSALKSRVVYLDAQQ